jgi:penicillin-binding protein 1A
MLQIKDEIPVRNFPDKPTTKRKVRLAVDPKTIAKPPKTQPKPKATAEQDAAQPKVETDQPTPVAAPLRQAPYLWRDSSPGNNVDRQGRRWTRD